MTYQVYQLINRETGLSYVGFSSNALNRVQLDHIEFSQVDRSERNIMRAGKRYPDFDMWNIHGIYKTPLEIEARMMTNAFISRLDTVDNGYNSQCGEVDSLCDAVAHSVITCQDVQKTPFDYYPHPAIDNVWVFKFYNKEDWSFGYQSEDGLWNMFGTGQVDIEDAYNEAYNHINQQPSTGSGEPGVVFIDNETDDEEFDAIINDQDSSVSIIEKIGLGSEYGTMGAEFMDDIDKPTPLQSLSQIQSIISGTHFCTEDDRDQFFNILCGLKGAA